MCNYVLPILVSQSVHWGPGGHSVSLRHEGSASCFSAWWTAPGTRPPGISKLWGRGNWDSTQRETPLPSRDSPSALSHPLPPCWLSDSAPQTASAALLSGVCGVSIQPSLASTKPLVSLWSLWFSGGVFLCAFVLLWWGHVCYFLLLSMVMSIWVFGDWKDGN